MCVWCMASALSTSLSHRTIRTDTLMELLCARHSSKHVAYIESRKHDFPKQLLLFASIQGHRI